MAGIFGKVRRAGRVERKTQRLKAESFLPFTARLPSPRSPALSKLRCKPFRISQTHRADFHLLGGAEGPWNTSLDHSELSAQFVPYDAPPTCKQHCPAP